MTDRRSILKAAVGGIVAYSAAPLFAAQASKLPVSAVAGKVSVIAGAPGNVIALNAADGIVLVDSGAANMAAAVKASLGGAKVTALLNTHYHADQTGGNELFGTDGAVIHSHVITRQWLAADYYVPSEDRYVKALPKTAWPSKTFREGKQELKVNGETVEYGYLLEAHTRGDMYVYFRDSNVLAVGDVASPERDPSHDWYAGGWLGGRVDAMDDLLEIAKDDTKIIPAYGPVMTKAQLKAERDMMAKLYDRTTDLTDKGRSARDMLDEGVMNEIDRKFNDPYRFLYDVSKGLWAHYTNFGGNIV